LGDIVVKENLGSHQVKGLRETIDATGADLLYLAPYSPDLDPIENTFAKLIALLRKATARTIEGLWNASTPCFRRSRRRHAQTILPLRDTTQASAKML
jgi:transposase